MSRATLLTRTQLLAHAMCSADKFRPVLQNLHVTADGQTVTATDGHMMLRVARINPAPADDYPIPSQDWTPPELPKDGFMFPGRQAVAMLKAQPKAARHFPILRQNVLLESLNGVVTLSATDLDSRPTVTERTPEGPYPNCDQVIPAEDRAGDTVVGVNPQLAAEFFATLAKMLKEDGQRADHVTLRIPANPKHPIRCDAASYDHTFLGLLMPTLIPAVSK